MQLKLHKIFILTSFLFSSSLLFSQQKNKEAAFVPGEMMVQLHHGYTIEQLIESVPVWTDLHAKEELSAHMRFWLLGFSDNKISHPEMMRLLHNNRAVRLVQNNHYIEERSTVPNDPNFNNQWHHVNTGQTGGTADADIDSDLAWDITTGGLTALGDTIVVCVVEGGGANYSHPDLIGNFWRNHGEIPNNSIDDDGNGYVDDYEGWDVGNGDDNHQSGNHGTQCLGMIGAKGNNSTGVAGVNWDVKMMLVSGFGISESSVIAAYNYPLVMRKMYNNSNGTEGAFVVSTSASWGIDQADPNDYPLWCAYYDTLGVYGILNVGATTNSNYDVDVVGDMPTACSSQYMVSVTRTSDTDGQAGGYGLTTIDFGAPGIDVYTTSGSNTYGTTTGTSFSCPLTAGAIGLIYSTPCVSLATLAKSDPQAAADQVLQALMDGTDPVASMNGISVTGGRLNVNNSVNEILNNCSASGCVTPYNLNSNNVSDTSANVSWSFVGTPVGFWFYLREQGSSVFDSSFVTTSSITIDTLNACTTYEYMVVTDCGAGDLSGYSSVMSFLTDGCCDEPTGLTATLNNDSTATFSWNSVLAAQGYNIRFRQVTSLTWTTISNATSPYIVDTLLNCTSYEVQVQTICDTGVTSFTSSVFFSTSGCGACEDLSYCASAGNNVSDEWIAGVSLNTLNNTSGPNNGYIMFLSATTSLENGSSYPITITPGYSGTAFTEYVKVWIDYNQDGTFTEPGELAYTAPSINSATTGSITVPASALTGTTRMRVTMKYYSATWDNTIPTSCLTFAYGEVEDYCVTITDIINTVEVKEETEKMIIFPNPSSGNINIHFYGEQDLNGITVSVMNSIGQTVHQEKIGSAKTTMDLSAISNGIYFIQVKKDGKTIRSGKILLSK